jgi:hypothetical protein
VRRGEFAQRASGEDAQVRVNALAVPRLFQRDWVSDDGIVANVAGQTLQAEHQCRHVVPPSQIVGRHDRISVRL